MYDKFRIFLIIMFIYLLGIKLKGIGLRLFKMKVKFAFELSNIII